MANMIAMTKTPSPVGGAGFTQVILTTGSLSAWVAPGAQQYLYNGSTLANSGATSPVTITTVTDATHFDVATGNGLTTGILSGFQNAAGLQVLIAAVLSGVSNAFQQNCATIPPALATASVAAGPLGFDQAGSIDLAPAGLSGTVLWFMGDTAWATASGQNRSATTNYVHNTFGIQTGGNYSLNYNTSAVPQGGSDSISFYGPTVGAVNPSPVLSVKQPGIWSYPISGICINPFCTLFSMQLTAVPGTTFPALSLVWINNISTGGVTPSVTAPSLWNVVEVPNPFGELMPAPTNTCQWVIYTDNSATPGTWVLCYGQAGANRNVYAFRFPFNDLNISSVGTPYFGNVQYWGGPQGWISGDLMQSPQTQSFYSQIWPSFGAAPTFGVLIDNSGGLYERTDGVWVYVNQLVVGLGEMFCSENTAITGPSLPSGGKYKQFWYESGVSQGSPTGFFTYGLRSHPEQTWVGKGTDDMLISYNTNSTINSTDTAAYWPVFLATSGL